MQGQAFGFGPAFPRLRSIRIPSKGMWDTLLDFDTHLITTVLLEYLFRDKIMESRHSRRRRRHQSQMLDESSTSLGFKTKKRKLSEVRAEEFLGRTIEALYPSSSSETGGLAGLGRGMQLL